jgi:hypothetical protein
MNKDREGRQYEYTVQYGLIAQVIIDYSAYIKVRQHRMLRWTINRRIIYLSWMDTIRIFHPVPLLNASWFIVEIRYDICMRSSDPQSQNPCHLRIAWIQKLYCQTFDLNDRHSPWMIIEMHGVCVNLFLRGSSII